jgi:uncharacterized membrane protein YuzA (DUF378 family)
MILGIVLIGILSGVVTMVATLLAGMGIGLALLAYPLGGIATVAVLSVMATAGRMGQRLSTDDIRAA